MTRTPPQQRPWDDLLAVDQPRPVPDPTWAEQLRERVEQSPQLAAACLPGGPAAAVAAATVRELV